MSAERGSLLEQLQGKGTRLSRIGSQRERLHEAIGRGEVKPASWEDVLRIGRVKSRVFKSRIKINSEIEEVDDEVIAEKQRLALQATFFPDELARRAREIAELTRMAYQGFIPEDEYSRKLTEYQVLKSDPEVALGQKILGERQKRMRRGHSYPLKERVVRKELMEPREIYVNEGIHEGFNAIAVNGQEVVFRDGLEWDFLAKLLEVNHQNRYRQDNPPISSLEINRELIRPDGHNRSVIELVGQINARFDLAGGDLIERQGKAKGTKYRINGRVANFFGPEKSITSRSVSMDTTGRPKVVPIKKVEESKPGVKEVVRTRYSLTLTRGELPWLPTEFKEVNLVKVKYGNVETFLGSEISNRDLIDAANQLDLHRSEIANNMLHTHLPQFIEGFNPHVKALDNTRTKQPIFYLSNAGGQRIYFMRFDNKEGIPVIVKVAVCDKATQANVLLVLTTDSKSQLKKTARL